MEVWYVGVVMVIVPQVGNAAIRASGDTKTPSAVMLVAVVLNIALDPILIFGVGPVPALGLRGAALATVISGSVTLVALGVLRLREGIITFRFPSIRQTLNSWKQILRLGLPNAATAVVTPLASGLITRLIASFGVAAVAGYGIAIRVQMFGFLLAMALASALGPFFGQNWGRDGTTARS